MKQLTLVLILSLVISMSHAATIHVPADEPTIQAGIDSAQDKDTVLVADGTYTGEGNVNIDFGGKQIAVRSVNGAAMTIVDCEHSPNTRGFIFQNEETNASVLDGFTIKNGVANINGGGIYCETASPTIKNCTITQNRAEANRFFQGGGGIYCADSSALITDCTITQNRVRVGGGSGGGGGVFFFVGNSRSAGHPPTLINCTISENIGSGVFCHGGSAAMEDCTVSRNRGRGIECNLWGRSKIDNCIIKGNTGGGIDCSEMSSATINDCVITHNIAGGGAGIVCSPSSSIEVSGCIIAQNESQDDGGGIYVGGGARITNCTITQNRANDKGGGVYIFVDGRPFTLENSILWNNTAVGEQNEISANGFRIIIRSCDIQGGLGGIGREPKKGVFIYENNIDADPRFVNAASGDYRLLLHSKAIGPPLMGAQPAIGDQLGVTPAGKRLTTWDALKAKLSNNQGR